MFRRDDGDVMAPAEVLGLAQGPGAVLGQDDLAVAHAPISSGRAS
jgi:hypothetical protein